jgi:hypothetical protein
MYTYRITNDENGIMVWIDQDGQPIIMQPHHHNALNNAPWESEAEAETWAIEALERLQQEAEQRVSLAAQAEADRQRLINIENMLKQLTGQE